MILPPLTGGGSWSQIQTLARSAAARGARKVVDDAAKNAFLVNVATAIAFDLPNTADLIAAAAHQGVDLTHFNGNGPRPRQWDDAFPAIYAVAGLAAGALTAAGQPWAAAAIGAVVAGVDLFTNLVGAPSLPIPDQFGQLEPAFLTWRISGKPGADIPANRPRQMVPDPPGLRSEVYHPAVPMLFVPPVLIPGMAGTPPQPTLVLETGGPLVLTDVPPTPAPWSTEKKVAVVAGVVAGFGLIGAAVSMLPTRRRRR